MRTIFKIVSILLIYTCVLMPPATCWSQDSCRNMDTLAPFLLIDAKDWEPVYFSFYQDYSKRSYKASESDIKAIIGRIENIKPGITIVNKKQHAEKLQSFFNSYIAGIENKRDFLEELLYAIEYAEPSGSELPNLIEILGMLFRHSHIQKEGDLSIDSALYEYLWQVYENVFDAHGTIASCIVKSLVDKRIRISDDSNKKKAKNFALGQFLAFIEWAIVKYRQGVPAEALNESLWLELLKRYRGSEFIDKAYAMIRDLDEESAPYQVVLHSLLVPLAPYSRYAREKVKKLAEKKVTPFIKQEVKDEKQAWNIIFENEKNARKFFEIASNLRKLYPYTMSLEDKKQRSPFQYAQEEDIVFQIGKNLFITPITESFRRHIIFAKNTQGAVVFSFEVVIPGEFIRKRDTYAKKRYELAELFREKQGEQEYCQEPLFYKEFPAGEYNFYGEKYEFSNELEARLGVVAFNYKEDGKRLAFIKPKTLKRLAEEFGTSRRNIEYMIAVQVAKITGLIHRAGYVGFDYMDSSGYGYDLHLENFRLIPGENGIKIQLVGDFNAFTKQNNHKSAEEEITMDRELLIEGKTIYRPRRNRIKGLKDLFHELKTKELYSLFSWASNNPSDLPPLNEPMQYELEEEQRYKEQLELLIKNSTEKQEIADIVNRHVVPILPKTGRKFLDIGAGDGMLSEEIIAHGNFEHTSFIEPNKEHIQTLRRALEKIVSCLQKEQVNLDVKIFSDFWQNVNGGIEDKFDLILLSHMLYYINPDEVIPFLEDVIEKLDKDGRLVIVLNSLERGASEHGMYSNFFNRFGDEKKAQLEPRTMIADKLQERGFKVEIFPIAPVVKTKSFEEFLEIGLFLLLEPYHKLQPNMETIREYLLCCKQGGMCSITIAQDVIVISRPDITQTIPVLKINDFYKEENLSRELLIGQAI